MEGLIGKRSGKVLPKDYEVRRAPVFIRLWTHSIYTNKHVQDAEYLRKLGSVVQQLDEDLPDVGVYFSLK